MDLELSHQETPTTLDKRQHYFVERWQMDRALVESTPPFATKVGIYHKNFSDPTYAIAKWDSYVQKIKDGTIAKCGLKFQML